MSIYVMSDIHGCYDEFMQMLNLISFSDYDELWIIGDVCDRGPKNMKLLQTIISSKNMHIIMGNHDAWLLKYSQYMIDCKRDFRAQRADDDYLRWTLRNGGLITSDQFMDLDYHECYDIKLYLENCPYYKELTVHGKKFLLVHAGLSEEYMKPSTVIASVPHDILIWEKIGLDANPFNDTTMIVGHTPTFRYGDEYRGKIAIGKNKQIYHIDCGCVFGKSLGCLRLDDLQEFYVPSLQPDRT